MILTLKKKLFTGLETHGAKGSLASEFSKLPPVFGGLGPKRPPNVSNLLHIFGLPDIFGPPIFLERVPQGPTPKTNRVLSPLCSS